jgi:hypothetical protein
MTLLYSHNNARPEPLHFRITLPNGFTRTDPTTFTEDEIIAAGFTGPYTEPSYDPATEQLDWADGIYSVTPLPPPPPQPRWVEFGTALGSDAQVNQFIASLAQAAPVLHLMVGVGMGQAAQGDSQTFLAAWAMGTAQELITPELAAHVAELAEQHNLPTEFALALVP